MIVVGAINPNTDTKWHKSNMDIAAGLPHLYAPGEDLYGLAFPLMAGFDPYRFGESGTSCGRYTVVPD